MSPPLLWTSVGSTTSTLYDGVVVVLVLLLSVLPILLVFVFGLTLVAFLQLVTVLYTGRPRNSNLSSVNSVGPSAVARKNRKLSRRKKAIKPHRKISKALPNLASAKPDLVHRQCNPITLLQARKIQGCRYKHKRPLRARSASFCTHKSINGRRGFVSRRLASSSVTTVKELPTPCTQPASIVAIKEIPCSQNAHLTESPELETVISASSTDAPCVHCPRTPTRSSFSLPYAKAERPQISLCSGKPWLPTDLLSLLTRKYSWSLPSLPKDWIHHFVNSLPPVVVYNVTVYPNSPAKNIKVILPSQLPPSFQDHRDQTPDDENEDKDGDEGEDIDKVGRLFESQASASPVSSGILPLNLESLDLNDWHRPPQVQPQQVHRPSQVYLEEASHAIRTELEQRLRERKLALPSLRPWWQQPASPPQILPPPRSKPAPLRRARKPELRVMVGKEPVERKRNEILQQILASQQLMEAQQAPAQQVQQQQVPQPQPGPQQQPQVPQQLPVAPQQQQPSVSLQQPQQPQPSVSTARPQQQDWKPQQLAEQAPPSQHMAQQHTQPLTPEIQQKSSSQQQQQLPELEQPHPPVSPKQLQQPQLQPAEERLEPQQPQPLVSADQPQQPDRTPQQTEKQAPPPHHTAQQLPQPSAPEIQQKSSSEQQQQSPEIEQSHPSAPPQPVSPKQQVAPLQPVQPQHPQLPLPPPQALPQPLPSNDVDMDKPEAPADTVEKDQMEVVVDVPSTAGNTIKDVEMRDESTDVEATPMVVDPALATPVPAPMSVPVLMEVEISVPVVQMADLLDISPQLQQPTSNPFSQSSPVKFQTFTQSLNKKLGPKKLPQQRQDAPPPVDQVPMLQVQAAQQQQQLQLQYQQQSTGNVINPVDLDTCIYESVVAFFTREGVDRQWVEEHALELGRTAVANAERNGVTLQTVMEAMAPHITLEYSNSKASQYPAALSPTAFDQTAASLILHRTPTIFDFIPPRPLIQPYTRPQTIREGTHIFPFNERNHSLDEWYQARRRGDALSSSSLTTFPGRATTAESARVYFGSGLDSPPQPIRHGGLKASMFRAAARPSSSDFLSRPVTAVKKPAGVTVGSGFGPLSPGRSRNASPKARMPKAPACPSSGPTIYQSVVLPGLKSLQKVVHKLKEKIDDEELERQEDPKVVGAFPTEEGPKAHPTHEDTPRPSGQILGKRKYREHDKIALWEQRPRKRPRYAKRVRFVDDNVPEEPPVSKRVRFVDEDDPDKLPAGKHVHFVDDDEPRGRSKTKSQGVKTRRGRSPSLLNEVSCGVSQMERDDIRRKSDRAQHSRSKETQFSSGTLGKRHRSTEDDRDSPADARSCARAAPPPSCGEVVSSAQTSRVSILSVPPTEDEEALRYKKRHRSLSQIPDPAPPARHIRSSRSTFISKKRPFSSKEEGRRVRLRDIASWVASIGLRTLWFLKGSKPDSNSPRRLSSTSRRRAAMNHST